MQDGLMVTEQINILFINCYLDIIKYYFYGAISYQYNIT